MSESSGRFLSSNIGVSQRLFSKCAFDRLLQHPALVLEDNFRRVQVEHPLQPVVSIDDAEVQSVQVAHGDFARLIEKNRPQAGRNYGNGVEHHPLAPLIPVANASMIFKRWIKSFFFSIEFVSSSWARKSTDSFARSRPMSNL